MDRPRRSHGAGGEESVADAAQPSAVAAWDSWSGSAHLLSMAPMREVWGRMCGAGRQWASARAWSDHSPAVSVGTSLTSLPKSMAKRVVLSSVMLKKYAFPSQDCRNY